MSDIAIIGAGPRGLAALQSLFASASDESRHTVYLCGVRNEAGELIAGWGSAYQPDQGDYIRLNANADIVDLWRHERAKVASSVAHALPHATPECVGDLERPSFRTWARQYSPRWADEQFPPRAVIGAYYQHCFQLLRQRVPPGWTFVELACARQINPAGSHRWQVVTDERTIIVDELLLAVGHATTHPDPLTAKMIGTDAVRCFPSPYPLAQLGDLPAGAHVAVRGAGLSFLDIALELTEGRGGTFHHDERAPTLLRYQPSGREVGTILPLGLTGRFAEAKPPRHLLTDVLNDGELERLLTLLHEAESLARVCEIIERALVGIALRIGLSQRDVTDFLTPPSPGPNRAARSLLDSVQVSLGIKRPTFAAYAGAMWAHIADEIVAVVSHIHWPKPHWQNFERLMQACTPHSYGPPPLGAQKLATLITAGVVDPSWLDRGISQTQIGQLHRNEIQLDAVIDAVLPPAGWWSQAYPQLSGLEEYLGMWPKFAETMGRDGVRIDQCARVLAATGRPVGGLAAIGRMTNNWVLSNDTLNRDVHDHPQRWATWVLTKTEPRV
ncbi:MAG: FAD/NAD(P)-binding protein [Bowdeniella nasicola]|nr:FAD/NAD(P)-binding protein [Bowdeniella nasicola]